MARTPLIAGNWKLNLGPRAAGTLAKELVSALSNRGRTEVVVFPTAVSVGTVLEETQGSGIEVGLQDIHSVLTGAFTGANSASMGREMGCTRALIGHSERRQIFGDTDVVTREKLTVARTAGLLPFLCVGETLEERDSGNALTVVIRQLSEGLKTLSTDALSGLVIAYEPVWAIGTGRVATPEQAQEMHLGIRQWLGEALAGFLADETRILYGGSVKPTNAAELLSCPDIDGALVGGASLHADKFASIVAAANT